MAGDPRSADVTMQPRGNASWANTDPRRAYVAHRVKWAKQVWPTGIVGPEDRIGDRGASLAHWAMQSYKAVPPYKGTTFLKFCQCGTNVYSCFAGDVIAREALDLKARTMRVDLVESNLPYLDQNQVRNSPQLISLVRSNG